MWSVVPSFYISRTSFGSQLQILILLGYLGSCGGMIWKKESRAEGRSSLDRRTGNPYLLGPF